MCLALVALDAHPRFPLVIAANRDEFHARVAAPAHWWKDCTLAGVDLAAGGTWFGVNARGRWALVTNFREGIPRDPNAPSRGGLVTRALAEAAPPLVSAAEIAADGVRYHGFNLLVGDVANGVYASNRASGALALGKGIHGLSNHLLDTPWPKLTRSKARFAACLAASDDGVEPLFELLADRTQAEATALPVTGVAPEWERLLSSAFIVDSRYGTRCSTVLTIAHDGSARFVERGFDPHGRLTGETAFEFFVRGR
ncbi:MAG TPA: NRDE family protein [Casimicrobiaceae bacterium]|nr:NRDE family protein [Casimicrobiaceae bacterium]